MSKLEKSLGDLSNEDIVNSLLEDFQNDISLYEQGDSTIHKSGTKDNTLNERNDKPDATQSNMQNPKIIEFENSDQTSHSEHINHTAEDLSKINQEKDPDDDDHESEKKEEYACEPCDDEGIDDTRLSMEEVKKLEETATQFKNEGNNLFKQKLWIECLAKYNEALRSCPKSCTLTRAVFYANQAAVYEKMEKLDCAISSCSKALDLNPSYLKAWSRRARLYRRTDKLDEALVDYQMIMEKDPSNREAIIACKELPQQINERNEKLKDEMLGKLKDLGNMILRPFGLSTNNFQMVQDPNSGGYSINFKQPN